MQVLHEQRYISTPPLALSHNHPYTPNQACPNFGFWVQLIGLEAELRSAARRPPEEGWPQQYQEAAAMGTARQGTGRGGGDGSSGREPPPPQRVMATELKLALNAQEEDEATVERLLQLCGRFVLAATNNLGAAVEATLLSGWDADVNGAVTVAVLGNVLVDGLHGDVGHRTALPRLLYLLWKQHGVITPASNTHT